MDTIRQSLKYDSDLASCTLITATETILQPSQIILVLTSGTSKQYG